MTDFWRRRDDKTHDAYWVEFEAREWGYYAQCKGDGCIHFYRLYNGCTYDQSQTNEHGCGDQADYLHICDLTEFIAELQRLKAARDDHFCRDVDDNYPNAFATASLTARSAS